MLLRFALKLGGLRDRLKTAEVMDRVRLCRDELGVFGGWEGSSARIASAGCICKSRLLNIKMKYQKLPSRKSSTERKVCTYILLLHPSTRLGSDYLRSSTDPASLLPPTPHRSKRRRHEPAPAALRTNIFRGSTQAASVAERSYTVTGSSWESAVYALGVVHGVSVSKEFLCRRPTPLLAPTPVITPARDPARRTRNACSDTGADWYLCRLKSWGWGMLE
jgi:hypothetical protein